MKKSFITLVVICFMTVAVVGAVFAQESGCWLNGELFPVGTTIDGKTCQSNGSWE